MTAYQKINPYRDFIKTLPLAVNFNKTRGGRMSMKKEYRCDICRESIKDPDKSFGLHFTDLKHFNFGAYGCTDGVHICYLCARQLKNELDNGEIAKILEEDDR